MNSKALKLLESTLAIVNTFSVETETRDIALSDAAIVNMLEGVHVLLDQATTELLHDSTIATNRGDWNDVQASELPKTWMFKSADFTTVNIDLVGCCC